MKKALLLLLLLAPPVRAQEEAKTAPGGPAGPTDGAPPAGAGAPPGAERFAEADAAYARRDDPGETDRIKELLTASERAAPDDYEVLWRLARLYAWISDDPAIADKEKSRLGKIGWEIAERAAAANPARVEGWHYAAVNMGNYSLGIGILRALGQGIEGKFKDRLSRAEKIDPAFSSGGIPTAWGRFWFKLPWPKYDAGKSEKALQAALRMNPDNVRARVYLADLYEEEGHKPEARELLERAAAAEPGRYDAPEERRYKEVARRTLARLERR
jgi:tetratricopeptide (TPR) repeat protein